MKSLPARTAELRANLVELADSPTHQKVMAGMAESMMRTYTAGSSVSQQMMEITSHLRRDAVMSELFTMSPEMMDLIEHSSKSLPPQIMVEQDLPAPFGLLHLPKELTDHDLAPHDLGDVEILTTNIKDLEIRELACHDRRSGWWSSRDLEDQAIGSETGSERRNSAGT
jgi:hypothetical protein